MKMLKFCLCNRSLTIRKVKIISFLLNNAKTLVLMILRHGNKPKSRGLPEPFVSFFGLFQLF